MSKIGAHVLDKQDAAADDAFEQSPVEPVLGEIELLPPDRPIAAYNPIKEAIAALTAQYGKVVFDVSTTAGMEAAKQARMAIRDPRYKIEHIRKALKAPALAHSKRIDDEAKEYTASLLAIETPIDDQIKAREKAIEDARIAKELAEAEERRKIDAAIADIQFTAVYAAGKSSLEIKVILEELGKRPMTEDEFGSRLSEAVLVKNATAQRLCDMHDNAATQEAEAERLRIANEEAARVRQQQEAEAARLQQEREDLQRQQEAFAKQTAATAPTVNVAQNAQLGTAWPQDRLQQFGVGAATPTPKPPNLGDVAKAVVPEPLATMLADPVPSVHDIDDSNPFPQPVVVNVPTLAEMVEVIADHYDVSPFEASQWMYAACIKGE